MSKKTELIKSTLILALGMVSTRLMSLLLLPLYTAYLSPSEYGAVDLTITYIVYLVPAITIQLEWASFRFLIDARNDEVEKKKIISNILQIVLIISAVCVALYLALDIFIDIPYSTIILLVICATIFSSLFLQFARGLGDNKKFAIASIITGATTLIATLIFVTAARWGAAGVLSALALANLMCSIYLFFALRLYRYISFKNRDKALQKSFVQYSSPLVPEGLSWWIINVSDRTIISVLISVAANGIYAVSNKYAAIFGSVFSVFNMSWTESASLHIDDKDRDKFFSETSNATIKLFGSLGLILIAFIPLVFTTLINSSYSEAYLYIPILILGAFFSAIVGLYSAIYIAKRLTKQIANTTLLAAVINIVLNLALIKFIGLYAAAISTAAAYAAMAIYRHHDIKKYVTITYQKNIFVKMAALYALTMTLYYYNNIFGNIANAVIITIVVILLNKSVIRVIKDKVLSLGGRKPKKLTPEQEIYEDSI